jgi:SAM-dependent methyltransferase
VDHSVAYQGSEPATGIWNALALSGPSLLEIGPGTGHLLAAARAAGLSVAGVETNEIHRRYISDCWGIDDVYPDMAAVPDGQVFENVVALNVLEHVYDVSGFLSSVRQVLAPHGVLYVSTVNAISIEAAVLRNWWSMCKEIDHVSFPSPGGMARAAWAAGLQVERLWSAELPFEFPVSVLVAARDWTRSRRPAPAGGGPAQAPAAAGPASRERLARLYALGAGIDPASRLLGSMGRAATVKARLRLAEHDAVRPA